VNRTGEGTRPDPPTSLFLCFTRLSLAVCGGLDARQTARMRPACSREHGALSILGGMLLASARHDPKMAAWVIEEAKKGVTRDIDKKRLVPLLRELEARHAKRS